jgi:hypothetical protein
LYYNSILDGIWDGELKLQWYSCDDNFKGSIKQVLKGLVGELAEQNKTMRTSLAYNTIDCDGVQVRIYLQIDIIGKKESNPRPIQTLF